MKIATWNDLKTFCNSIPEKQLSEPVMWWGDERGGKINSADFLEDDYVNMGYGCEPKSVYLNDPDYEKDEVESKVVHGKGTAVLYTD